MNPTPSEIAAAIIAAARETGANPEEVVMGVVPGASVETMHATSRARAYAGRALDRVFNRMQIVVPRPKIALWIGATKQSAGSFFTSLDGRPLSWWSDEVFNRVVNAVMDAEPPADEIARFQPPGEKPPPPPPLKMGDAVAETAIGALRPTRGGYTHGKRGEHPIGSLDPNSGFRPAPGTYERELKGHGPLRTRLDAFADRSGKPRAYEAGGDEQLASREREKRQSRDLLAEAAANTAKLQAKLPPEQDD